MSGKDMASKLRDLGFTKAKSHMSALDEFEVIRAEGLLQAHGVIGEAKPADDGETTLAGDGLILKRKKKKKKPAATAVEAEAVEPAPSAEPLPASELETAPSGGSPSPGPEAAVDQDGADGPHIDGDGSVEATAETAQPAATRHRAAERTGFQRGDRTAGWRLRPPRILPPRLLLEFPLEPAPRPSTRRAQPLTIPSRRSSW